MGLTTPSHPDEGTLGGKALPAGVDPVPGIELSEAEVELITDFVRFLAPPTQRKVEPDRQTIDEGEKLFHLAGCSRCHIPTMKTGRHEVAALSNKRFPIYSDLLLHDVGTGDGIKQAAAEPNEIRTPALWGLRLRRPLLHDGSAGTIREAIERHREEAGLARRGFERLSDADKAALIAFLNSL